MAPLSSKPFSIEIIEDATAGILIRLQHNGRFPDLLAEFPKDVVRKARPWIWSSFERRVLKKARTMLRESYRVIRDMLIAERARVIMAKGPKGRLSWLQRRRLIQAKLHQAMNRVASKLPQHGLKVVVREPVLEKPVQLQSPKPEVAKSQPVRQVLQPERATERVPETVPTPVMPERSEIAQPEVVETLSLTERVRLATGTALAAPQPEPERLLERVRSR